MFCKNCGKEIGNQETFCTHCGSPVQQVGNQPPPVQTPPIQTPPGKGLKIAFFSMLGLAVVAFGVFAYLQWIQPQSNSQAALLNGLPKTDMSALSNLDTAELSLAGNGTTATPSAVAPTENQTKILGAWEWCSEIVYYGIEFYNNGTALYVEDDDQETYTYSIAGNTLTLTDSSGTSQGIAFEFQTYYGDEYLALSLGEESLDFIRVESLSVQTAATSPSSTPATGGRDPNIVFANGFEMDIEAHLDQMWWGSTGTWVDNPAASAAAPGYPKTYNLRPGEVQYVFDADTMTVQYMYMDENGAVTDKGPTPYELDPYGFFLYAYQHTQNIAGTDYELQSMFFVCDGVLYEVEMIDGTEVSNYIAYELYSL